MAEKIFCNCQLYAKGDSKSAVSCNSEDPEAQLFCGAHLNESRAFPCYYTPDEIYKDKQTQKLKIAHRKQGKLIGICEDFKPAETSNQR